MAAQVLDRGVSMMLTLESVSSVPVHGDFVGMRRPGSLGEHEQFGVEEPALVRYQRQQLPCLAGADRP